MPKKDEATYLGAEITKKNLHRKEVYEQINKAPRTCKEIKVFLRKTTVYKKWKMQVYNAVVISQFVYGLECTLRIHLSKDSTPST